MTNRAVFRCLLVLIGASQIATLRAFEDAQATKHHSPPPGKVPYGTHGPYPNKIIGTILGDARTVGTDLVAIS
jgi:hypothetical protein